MMSSQQQLSIAKQNSAVIAQQGTTFEVKNTASNSIQDEIQKRRNIFRINKSIPRLHARGWADYVTVGSLIPIISTSLTALWIVYMLGACLVVTHTEESWRRGTAIVSSLVYSTLLSTVLWLIGGPWATGSTGLFSFLLEHNDDVEHRLTNHGPPNQFLSSRNWRSPALWQQSLRQQTTSDTSTLQNFDALCTTAISTEDLPMIAWMAHRRQYLDVTTRDGRSANQTPKASYRRANGWDGTQVRRIASQTSLDPTKRSEGYLSPVIKVSRDNLTEVPGILHAMSQPNLTENQFLGVEQVHLNVNVVTVRKRSKKMVELPGAIMQPFYEVEWAGLVNDRLRPRSHIRWVGEMISKVFDLISYQTKQLVLSLHFRLAMILRNFGWCAIYVWGISTMKRTGPRETWDQSYMPNSFWFIEAVFQWSLTLDYVVCFAGSAERLKFLSSPTSLIDLLTLPATQFVIQLVGAFDVRTSSLLFGMIRFFRLFRLDRALSDLFPFGNPVVIIIIGLAVDSAVIIMSFACAIYLIEGPDVISGFTTLTDFIYFSVVTMSTVGFGDFAPSYPLSRIIASVSIIGGFIMFPYHVQRLLTALHTPPAVIGRLPQINDDYIFIYGKIRPRQLAIFAQQAADALPGSITNILVISPCLALRYKAVVETTFNRSRMKICVSQKCPKPEELELYCSMARAVIIVCDAKPQTTSSILKFDNVFADMYAEDQRTFLRLTNIQKWCWPNVPIIVQFSHGRCHRLAEAMGAYHVISLEQVKMRLLGKSASGCQGFIPLILNMFTVPVTDSVAAYFFRSIKARMGRENKKGWETRGPQMPAEKLNGQMDTWTASSEIGLDERNFYCFYRGMCYQLYRLEFSPEMQGMQFSLAARFLYRCFGVLLIGVISVDNMSFLNPIGYQIGTESPMSYPYAGIVLAPSLGTVSRIAKFEGLSFAPSTAELEQEFIGRHGRSVAELKTEAEAFKAAQATHDPSKQGRASHIGEAFSYGPSAARILKCVESDVEPNSSSESIGCIREISNANEVLKVPHQAKMYHFVLCCGWPRALSVFLQALHANKRHVRIVVLYPASATEDQCFEDHDVVQSVFWLRGSGLKNSDLLNSGVTEADTIVVFPGLHVSLEPSVQNSTPAFWDNQALLVRQQIVQLLLSLQGSRQPCERKLPQVLLDLQEHDSVDYVSTPRDLFLLSAYRQVFMRKARGGQLIFKSRLASAKADPLMSNAEMEWRREGGRQDDSSSQNTSSNRSSGSPKFDAPKGLTSFTTKSEYRSGRLFIPDALYPLINYNLALSRFSVDSGIIDYFAVASHARWEPQNIDRKSRILTPALTLVPLPPMLNGQFFKDAFSYMLKMELRLVIGVYRKVAEPEEFANPVDVLKCSATSGVVFTCPPPDITLVQDDLLFVVNPLPKFATGILAEGHSEDVALASRVLLGID